MADHGRGRKPYGKPTMNGGSTNGVVRNGNGRHPVPLREPLLNDNDGEMPPAGEQEEEEVQRKPRLAKYQWLILMSLNTIGPFSSDAYVPNLSQIAKELNTSNQLMSLTIQVNWILLGLFNPVVGAMSDKYGRKAVICVALLVYCAGALGSAFSRDINELIIARCVQGAGEAVSVVTSAIIRDVVDDLNERQRLQAFFAMLRPLMIMAAPVVGGALAGALGWRKLFFVLAGWGVLTLFLVQCCIPESNNEDLFRSNRPSHLKNRRNTLASPELPRVADLEAAEAADTPQAQQVQRVAPTRRPRPRKKKDPDACCCLVNIMLPGFTWKKLGRMCSNSDYALLTITAALFMGAVRAMLSNVAYVYDNTYTFTVFETGALIAAPTVCGLLSSMFAAKMSKTVGPARMMRYGMGVGLLAPILMLVSGTFPFRQCSQAGHVECLYDIHWTFFTVPLCVMSFGGFLALPAMQTLVMHDFKDMSGLAGGLSKLVMTLISTGIAMFISFYFGDWSRDHHVHEFWATMEQGHGGCSFVLQINTSNQLTL